MQTSISNVAGVTFKNADGTSRQDVLKYFGEDCCININLVKQTYFNPETKKSEIAIACIEKNTKAQLGFISKKDITPELMKIKQITGFVKYNNMTNIFYCELSETQSPSSETYKNIKKFCENNNLTMPAYDIRAYQQFSKWLKTAQKKTLPFALTAKENNLTAGQQK